MTKQYSIDDTNHMEWEEFHKITNSLIDKLDKYQKENNIKFDAITPILRSGAIPATMIANKLQIIPFIPVQVKHDCLLKDIVIKLSPTTHSDINCNDYINILVVETNTSSGKSAIKTLELLNDKFPNATIHYSSIAKVHGVSTQIDQLYKTCHYGIHTNEAFIASKEKEITLKLRNGITIFPWETATYELDEING